MAADVSEASARLQAEMVGKLDAPARLHEAWAAGRVADADLADLIPHTWLRHDWPELVIGADRWIAMFRAAGFLLHPTYLTRPTTPLVLYRGAPTQRISGMAWNRDQVTAEQFQRRYGGPDLANLYRTMAPPDAMLAVFVRGTEGIEIVVDPSLIEITRIDATGGVA